MLVDVCDVLARPRVQVEVEMAHAMPFGCVVHDKQAHVRVPRVEIVDLGELEREELLVDLHRCVDDVVQGKVPV